MPSIRHHLRTAEALLIAARAHLESAFEHAIDAHYDPDWPASIDRAITNTAANALHVNNITTLIMPPTEPPTPKEN